MTFNPLIPQPAHYLAQSQGDLLSNNGQLNNVEGVNHVSFDNAIPVNSLAAERGKHHMVELLNRDTSGSAPPYAIVDPAGTITEMVFYAKDRVYAAPIGITETTLYLRKANGNLFQMSGLDPVAAQTGSTFLPGGIVIKWGIYTGNGAAVQAPANTNTFVTPFPNACWSVVVTGGNFAQPTNVCKVANLTTASFWGRCPAGEQGFYIAIGN
jgi:hypothetical protein